MDPETFKDFEHAGWQRVAAEHAGDEMIQELRTLIVGALALVAFIQPGGSHAAAVSAAQKPSGQLETQLVTDLVTANRILTQQEIFEGFGHVSVRSARNPDHYLLARSIAPGLVTSSDVMEFDLESRPLDQGGRSLYSERFIHGEIYKARPDVTAVVHNHAPALIPFGITGVPLRPVYHMSSFVGAGVPTFDIRRANGATDMLVSTAALGRELAATLGKGAAVLMRGHGATIVGTSLSQAVGRAVYLDLNARIQLQATALGGAITYLTPEEVEKIRAGGEQGAYSRDWELWRHQLSEK
jgi:HCOMODA/2-hydroxy-3-carboxy-muconic semialdehyde decarboxylase